MKKILISAIAVALIGGGIYFAMKMTGRSGEAEKSAEPSVPDTSGATAETIAEISKYQYTESYKNPDYGFTFKYPKDFTISNIPSETSQAIVVQNIPKKIGVQILISKFDGSDSDLTADSIHAEIPDMKIGEPQEVLVGQNRKGLAFISDNEAFGGKSREVWFVYGGYLYQISTYVELDEFLKGLFGTWQFR